jgi:hypothetical protein
MNPFEKAAYVPSKWGNLFHTRKENEVLGAGAAGPGKALALDTLVPTPIGFRYFKDIHPGDIVFNVHGKQVRVIAETEIFTGRDCYRLHIADENIVCDGEHLWNAADGRIFKTSDIHNSPFIPQLSFAQATENEPSKLLLDAYCYGYCLVRGQPSDRSVFTTWDPESYSILHDIGYTLDTFGHKAARIRERTDLINELIPAKGRRILPMYMNGSFNQRMAVVEGIMDGNSGMSPEVNYEDYPFLTDFYCLASSLGLGPKICQPRFRKTWYLKLFSKSYKCSRRTGQVGAAFQKRYCHRIKSIKRVESVPTKCIQVEGGGTFLITKSYVPTHNSMVLLMDPMEQVQIEHIRCQLGDGSVKEAPENFGQYKELLEKHPLRWGHSEGWILHLRRTLPRLSETITRSHRIFPLIDPEAKWNEKNHIWTFSSGIKYEFGHCKDRTDYNNYLGKQYSYIGWDELVEFNKEQYDFISSRIRTGDPVLRHFLKNRSATNPRLSGNKGEDISIDDPAWVKRHFVDPCPEGKKVLRRKIVRKDGTVEYVTKLYLPATLYDNPDPEFIKQYELQLMSRPKHIRDCYLYGRWDTVIGSHFGEVWNPTIHVCKSFKIPHDWPVFRAGDWGYATNGTVGWYAISPEDVIYNFYEITFKQKNATEVANMIKYFEEKNKLWDPNQGSKIYGPMDGQLWEERGSSFKTKYQEMVEVGVDWCKADQKSRETNCEVFTNRLKSHDNFTKLPGIVFFENCKNSIQTIPALETDPNNLEVPKKGGQDHWYDRNSYACKYAQQSGLTAPNYKGEIHYEDSESEFDGDRGQFGYW